MFEIYRRFDNETKKAPANNPVPRQQAPVIRQNQLPMLPAPQNGKTPQTVGNAGVQNYGQPLQQGHQTDQRTAPMHNKKVRTLKLPGRQEGMGQDKKTKESKPLGFLKGFLPSSLYDSSSKKLFGFLAAEDLLLVALIFLLLDRDGEDNLLLIIALGYILISDYIDLPEFGF